ncbi:MAG: hypothetical protein IKG37_04330 [Solobacterium sp.]|nr:hypothetical protein [Solobacterium sp.]
MSYVLIAIGAVLALIMSACIAQNTRNIEFMSKLQKNNVEATAAGLNRIVDRFNKAVNGINANTDTFDANFTKIFKRLDEIAADIKRLDEIDMRSQRAIQQANDIANRYVLYREPKEDQDDNGKQ